MRLEKRMKRQKKAEKKQQEELWQKNSQCDGENGVSFYTEISIKMG